MLKLISSVVIILACFSLISFHGGAVLENQADSLRAIYSQPSSKWPRANVDEGVPFVELGPLPEPPIWKNRDSLKPVIELGKLLFFEPKLSVSNQISCGTCHVPDLNWADGRGQAVGHDRTLNKRNTPTIENTWFYKKLFWDGRANSLEEQVIGPVEGHTEMNQDLASLPAKLQAIEGYRQLFKAAFGDEKVTNERVFHALAQFERSIASQRTRFDFFLAGKKDALTDQEIRGLHLYRTKANCMSCHNGPLFTDGDFHNIGLSFMGRPFEDLGRYNITKDTADLGKFKTPSLRSVMRTRPWMHHGFFDDMEGLVAFYNGGNPQGIRKDSTKNGLPVPKLDSRLKKLNLTRDEIRDIVAFMNAITSAPFLVREPKLPR